MFSRFEDSRGKEGQQQVIRAVLQEKDSLRILLARDEWFCPDMPVQVGDILHYIGDFGPGWWKKKKKKRETYLLEWEFLDGVGIVDRVQNFLVVNPDRLVRVTSIGDAVSCLRRSVLSEKLKVQISFISLLR